MKTRVKTIKNSRRTLKKKGKRKGKERHSRKKGRPPSRHGKKEKIQIVIQPKEAGTNFLDQTLLIPG